MRNQPANGLPPSEWSVLAHRSGVPWWGAVAIGGGATLLGVAIDLVRGDTLTAVFLVLYVLGCLAAVLAVRQRGLFAAMVQPPLLLAVAVPVVVLGLGTPTDGSTRSKVIAMVLPLINGFPTMALATLTVVTIGVVRLILRRDHRPAHTSRTASRRAARQRPPARAAANRADRPAPNSAARRGRSGGTQSGGAPSAAPPGSATQPPRNPQDAAGTDREGRRPRSGSRRAADGAQQQDGVREAGRRAAPPSDNRSRPDAQPNAPRRGRPSAAPEPDPQRGRAPRRQLDRTGDAGTGAPRHGVRDTDTRSSRRAGGRDAAEDWPPLPGDRRPNPNDGGQQNRSRDLRGRDTADTYRQPRGYPGADRLAGRAQPDPPRPEQQRHDRRRSPDLPQVSPAPRRPVVRDPLTGEETRRGESGGGSRARR